MTPVRYEVWSSELMELEEGEAPDPRHDTIVVVTETDYLKLVADYDKLTKQYEDLQDQIDEM